MIDFLITVAKCVGLLVLIFAGVTACCVLTAFASYMVREATSVWREKEWWQ